MRVCSVEGCGKKYCAKGLCNSHWAVRHYAANRVKKVQQKRDWVAKNGDYVRFLKRRNHYKNQFGITLEQYEELLKAQNGACKLCGSTDPRSKRKTGLQVDHCHKTGKIRGLLCVPCNLGLGHLQDSPELILKAALYVQNN